MIYVPCFILFVVDFMIFFAATTFNIERPSKSSTGSDAFVYLISRTSIYNCAKNFTPVKW